MNILTVQNVVAVVCRTLVVSEAELCGRSKHADVVLARTLIALLARRHTHASFPEIAAAIGRDNHSTVVTAHNRAKEILADTWPGPRHEGMTIGQIASLCEVALDAEGEGRVLAARVQAKQRARDVESVLGLPCGQLAKLAEPALMALSEVVKDHPTLRETFRVCASARAGRCGT